MSWNYCENCGNVQCTCPTGQGAEYRTDIEAESQDMSYYFEFEAQEDPSDWMQLATYRLQWREDASQWVYTWRARPGTAWDPEKPLPTEGRMYSELLKHFGIVSHAHGLSPESIVKTAPSQLKTLA